MASLATHVIHELNITVLGQCQQCGEFLVMSESWIPEHNLPEGEYCKGSKYSFVSKRYKIEHHDQAIGLAQAISADKSVCVGGRESHTMACLDGQRCADERRLRSQALASYFLAIP